MAKTLKYRDYLKDKIKNPVERAAYINAALEDGDPKVLLAVMKDCVESMGGISWLANETHMTRAAIYKILSREGNPKYDSLQKVMTHLGLRLNVEPVLDNSRALAHHGGR